MIAWAVADFPPWEQLPQLFQRGSAIARIASIPIEGRYTTSDQEARFLEPVQLLRRLGSVPRLIPLLLDVPNKDRISMIRLPGGGGLLSYCKEGSVYVHTFNTESGLIRKVDALGLTNWRCILDPEPAGSCAEACSACVAVLPFLLDAEKRTAGG